MRIEHLPTGWEGYDLGIFGLGYETRSPNVFLEVVQHCRRKLAIGYDYYQEEFDYPKNKAIFRGAGAEVREPGDEKFEDAVRQELLGVPQNDHLHVLIDISVFSRFRISTLIWLLNELLPVETTVDVVYNVPDFVPPPDRNFPVAEFGPISDGFRGELGNATKPVVLICGVGYERDKALGAVATIDPAAVFLLYPISPDPRYDEASRNSNEAISRSIEQVFELSYDLSRPLSTYLDLKSLVAGLVPDYRVVIMPIGPKLLTAIAALVATEFGPQLSVWRVSSGAAEPPLNKKPSGKILGFRFLIDQVQVQWS